MAKPKKGGGKGKGRGGAPASNRAAQRADNRRRAEEARERASAPIIAPESSRPLGMSEAAEASPNYIPLNAKPSQPSQTPARAKNLRGSADQRRAEFALNRINMRKLAGNYGNYRAHVRSLPATIMTSGLGQALAMEQAQGSSDKMIGHRLLFEDVTSWLLQEWSTSPYHGAADIFDGITRGPEEAYLRAQDETMAILQWLKLFAEAKLEKPSGAGERI